jgi:hypothetical protein
MDYDKDGRISYEDLQSTIGKYISPEESLYFRQDIAPSKVRTCRMNQCWNLTKDMGQYCTLHLTILRSKADRILHEKVHAKLAPDKWN